MFREIFGIFFAVFEYLYLLIPRFLVELLTLFCELCWLGNSWPVHESCSKIESFKKYKKEFKCLFYCRFWLYARFGFNFRGYTHIVTVTTVQSKTRSLVLVSIWRAAKFPLPPFPCRPGHEHNTVTENLKMTIHAICNDLTIITWNAVFACSWWRIVGLVIEVTDIGYAEDWNVSLVVF